MARPQSHGDGTLQREIDQYLADSQMGTSSIAYWQVRLLISIYASVNLANEPIQPGKSTQIPHFFLSRSGLPRHSGICSAL